MLKIIMAAALTGLVSDIVRFGSSCTSADDAALNLPMPELLLVQDRRAERRDDGIWPRGAIVAELYAWTTLQQRPERMEPLWKPPTGQLAKPSLHHGGTDLVLSMKAGVPLLDGETFASFLLRIDLQPGMKSMDKDRIKGAAQKIKGGIKEAVGKMTGNRKLEADGKIDKAAGSVRQVVGEAKDVVRDVVKDNAK